MHSIWFWSGIVFCLFVLFLLVILSAFKKCNLIPLIARKLSLSGRVPEEICLGEYEFLWKMWHTHNLLVSDELCSTLERLLFNIVLWGKSSQKSNGWFWWPPKVTWPVLVKYRKISNVEEEEKAHTCSASKISRNHRRFNFLSWCSLIAQNQTINTECLLWIHRVQRWVSCFCQLVSELYKFEAIPFVSFSGPPHIRW